jgi:hypothetical protein
MDPNSIKCKCGKIFTKQDFHQHFQKCQDFKNNFKHFDQEFGELLKRYSEPKDNLFIIKFLLSQYILVLDKKIQNYLAQSSASKPSGMNNDSVSNNPNFSGYNNNNPFNNSKNNTYTNSNNAFPNSNNNPFNNQNNYGIKPSPINNPFNKKSNDPFNQRNEPVNNPMSQNKNNPFNKVGYQQEGNLEVCQICKSPEITYLYSFNMYQK